MLRVAVVGSGPAGAYTVAALTERADACVDVIDRLPCPFGLVRYGVAPDHPKIQSISATLAAILTDPGVRFLGNVEVGTDVTLAELHRFYDAVVLASGAAVDRRLGIPGEDLAGSCSATEFVAWYSGHPDAPLDCLALDARTVAVVGAGNVALDVCRMLARAAGELATSDAPQHVLEALRASRVEDVHLYARRGPAQARFTTKELREVGELADADVRVDPADLMPEAAGGGGLEERSVARRNLAVLEEWADRSPRDCARRVHLHFLRRPVRVLGEGRVTGLRVERTRLLPDGSATGTGTFEDVDAQMVVRSVGYQGRPLPGLPFDERRGTVPHEAGRVLRDNRVATGEYVAGWIKRGPTGVIGTNKADARETVASLLADAADLPRAPDRQPGALPRLLAGRGVPVVAWPGWCAIDAAERDLGRRQGRERAKIVDRAALLGLAATVDSA